MFTTRLNCLNWVACGVLTFSEGSVAFIFAVRQYLNFVWNTSLTSLFLASQFFARSLANQLKDWF